ncbi:protein of unknown function [Methylorubrum extorquens]|uniref:Uncharacterized protein n=1 Tax=Methylorubrum extorquens TaxID=408 RepID=A0A2N9AJQ9_METEX|nr:protein of unknown function [Methylorubrum extorquens]
MAQVTTGPRSEPNQLHRVNGCLGSRLCENVEAIEGSSPRTSVQRRHGTPTATRPPTIMLACRQRRRLFYSFGARLSFHTASVGSRHSLKMPQLAAPPLTADLCRSKFMRRLLARLLRGSVPFDQVFLT